jgi:hypothetical protein
MLTGIALVHPPFALMPCHVKIKRQISPGTIPKQRGLIRSTRLTGNKGTNILDSPSVGGGK